MAEVEDMDAFIIRFRTPFERYASITEDDYAMSTFSPSANMEVIWNYGIGMNMILGDYLQYSMDEFGDDFHEHMIKAIANYNGDFVQYADLR